MTASRPTSCPVPPAQYLIPAEWQSLPISSQLQRTTSPPDKVELVYTDDYGSGLGKMPKNNFCAAPGRRLSAQPGRTSCAAGYGLFYGAFENRGGNPSLG